MSWDLQPYDGGRNYGFNPRADNYGRPANYSPYNNRANNYTRNYRQAAYHPGGQSGYRVAAPPNSGCKQSSRTKTGIDKGVIISAWRRTKFGKLSVVAVPAAEKYQGLKSGNLKMVCKVTQGIQSALKWGTWNQQKGILYVQEVNLIASPGKNAAWFRKTPNRR